MDRQHANASTRKVVGGVATTLAADAGFDRFERFERLGIRRPPLALSVPRAA